MSSEIAVSNQTNEVILDELKNNRDEVVAQWKLTEGEHGPLATYVELSPEADEILKGRYWQDTERGQAFISHRVMGMEARDYSQHRRLGNFAQALGFSYADNPAPGIVRLATLPTASALNGALDTMPRMAGRVRFYEPTTKIHGNATLEEYLPKLEQGLVPLGAPEPDLSSQFFHDLRDHSMGWVFIDAKHTELIKKRAGELKDIPVERDEHGYGKKLNPVVAFAMTVDELSNSLNGNVVFEWDGDLRYIPEIAQACAALRLKREVAYRNSTGHSFAVLGLGAALALTRSKRAEYN